jgi:hypothetical protein
LEGTLHFLLSPNSLIQSVSRSRTNLLPPLPCHLHRACREPHHTALQQR